LTQTEQSFVPKLTFYADFPEDWERFDDKTRTGIGSFLKRLQSDPFDPTIAAVSEKNGGYYATRIGHVVVYWKLALKDETFENAIVRPDAIYVLAVHPAAQVTQ